jgi:HSP20 family protein
MRTNTFDDIDRLFDRMNHFAGFDDGSWGGEPMQSSTMKVDVSDHGDELVVMADLPGFDREEIELSVKEGQLTIAASEQTHVDEEDEEHSYVHRERSSRTVRRNISLPVDIDADGASATYTNGVLTVTLPTLQETGGHHIDIK